MTALLWTLVALGAWNLLNLIVRMFCFEFSFRYVPSIAFGLWAGVLLWMGAHQ
jgi:hypothetical protein